MNKKRLFQALGILSFVTIPVLAAGIYVATRAPVEQPLPVLGAVPDFLLYDSLGAEFGRERLDGKIWVVDFVFTSCGGSCPIMSKNLSDFHQAFKLEKQLRVVSVSVDPERDSPEVMKEYAQKLSANTEQWHFLTGSAESVRDLAVKGFKIGSIEEPLLHSARFVLVDGAHQIRGYYDGMDDAEIQKLYNDTRRLLKESRSSL